MFRGINCRLVAKNLRATAPGPKKIAFDHFLRFLSLLFSGVMGVLVAAFNKQLATQPVRSGGASASSNAGVPAELWVQHGDWRIWEARKRYMESDTTRLLSVSRAAMGPPNTSAPNVRIECESAGAPPEMAEEDQRLPTWSGYLRVHLFGRETKGREVVNLFAVLHGGHIFITSPHLMEPRRTYVHPLPTNEVLVWCMTL